MFCPNSDAFVNWFHPSGNDRFIARLQAGQVPVSYELIPSELPEGVTYTGSCDFVELGNFYYGAPYEPNGQSGYVFDFRGGIRQFQACVNYAPSFYILGNSPFTVYTEPTNCAERGFQSSTAMVVTQGGITVINTAFWGSCKICSWGTATLQADCELKIYGPNDEQIFSKTFPDSCPEIRVTCDDGECPPGYCKCKCSKCPKGYCCCKDNRVKHNG